MRKIERYIRIIGLYRMDIYICIDGLGNWIHTWGKGDGSGEERG